MTRTYPDSGVLIAAARGSGKLAQRALTIISDTSTREFVCSDYVKFEIVPKPTYFGRQAELRFYETFFATAAEWVAFDVSHLHRVGSRRPASPDCLGSMPSTSSWLCSRDAKN